MAVTKLLECAVKKERSLKALAAQVYLSNSNRVASANTYSIPELSASKIYPSQMGHAAISLTPLGERLTFHNMLRHSTASTGDVHQSTEKRSRQNRSRKSDSDRKRRAQSRYAECRSTSAVGPSRHSSLPYEFGRYRSKADVVTSHITPPGL